MVEEYQIVPAPKDPKTEEILKDIEYYQKWRKSLDKLAKPGHQTHVPAKGRFRRRRTDPNLIKP